MKNNKQKLIEHIKKSLGNYDNGNGYALPKHYEGNGLAIDIFLDERWNSLSDKGEQNTLFLDPTNLDEELHGLLRLFSKQARIRFCEMQIILKEISAEILKGSLFVHHENDTRLTIKPDSDSPITMPPAYVPRYRIIIKPEQIETLRDGLKNIQEYKNTGDYHILKTLQAYNPESKTHDDASKFLSDEKELFISVIPDDEVQLYDHLSAEEINKLAKVRMLEIADCIREITGNAKDIKFVAHGEDKRFTNKLPSPVPYGLIVNKEIHLALMRHCMHQQECINSLNDFVLKIADQTEEPKKIHDLYETKKGELLDQDISLERKADRLLTSIEEMVETLKPKAIKTTASKIKGVFTTPLTTQEQFEKFKTLYTRNFPNVVEAEGKAEKVESAPEIKGLN